MNHCNRTAIMIISIRVCHRIIMRITSNFNHTLSSWVSILQLNISDFVWASGAALEPFEPPSSRSSRYTPLNFKNLQESP